MALGLTALSIYIQPFVDTVYPQINGPLYSNAVIGTLPLMGELLHLVQR